MDPTSRFFTKLRKLAVTLETETAKLQQAYQTLNDDDSENTEKAMRTYHELNFEIRDLKVQVRDQLAQQRAKEDEVDCFIKACMVMEQRLTQDIQTMKGQCEKYGYQDTRKPTKVKGQESEATHEGAEVDEEAGNQDREEAGLDLPVSPPRMHPLPSTDPLRTPQLSDFGLSEMQLKKVMTGAELCSEVPPMPEMSLPHPSLYMPVQPPMPVTPKCTLRMEEDELQTPQMHDFGISDHTMCLNNDFTMDLHRKNVEQAPRPQDLPMPPVNSLMDNLYTKADLESPEPPVFCTPGLKITKSNGRSSPPPLGGGDPESPDRPGNLPTTPEVPAFQTPYINRLLRNRHDARDLQPADTQAADENPTFHLTPPSDRAAGSKQPWEYNVPKLSFGGVNDTPMPEMPSLESILGSSLLSRTVGVSKGFNEGETGAGEPSVPSLDLDGPTQEFSLRTPNFRRGYREPSTPEMPDLSALTQDICKLVSQTQLKKTTVAAGQPHPRPPGKENRAKSLSVVSESEFQSLPRYLRQMTLSSLNQAIHKINSAVAETHHGEEFLMEELQKITCVGTRAPIYFLCLMELKRLEQVHGVESRYKLLSHN